MAKLAVSAAAGNLIRLNRSLVLFLAIIAFLTVASATTFINSNYQDYSGIRSIFQIKSLPAGKSDAQILKTINRVAQDRRVNIYRSVPNAGINDRAFYGFIGDPGANPAGADGVFRAFNPSPNFGFRLEPYQSFPSGYSLLGRYLSSADYTQMYEIYTELRNRGIAADYDLFNLAGDQLHKGIRTFYQDTGGIILVAFWALLVAGIYHGARKYRDCVIKSVCGRSLVRSVLVEYLLVFLSYATLIALLVLIGLPLLYAYNRFAQFGYFISSLTATLAIGYAVLLVALSLSFIALGSRGWFEILKGHKPGGLIAGFSVGLQVVAFGTVFLTLVSGINSIAVLAQEIGKADAWSKALGYAQVQLVTPNPRAESNFRFIDFERREEAENRLLVSSPAFNLDAAVKYAEAGPSSASTGFIRNVSYLINSRYLKDQTVLDASGRRIENLPQQNNHVYVLVAEDNPYSDRQILQGVSKWARQEKQRALLYDCISASGLENIPQNLSQVQAELDRCGRGQDSTSAEDPYSSIPPVNITLIKLAKQNLFTYETPNTDWLGAGSERAKLLVYTPLKSNVLASYPDSGVFFTDPKSAADYLVHSGIADDFKLESSVAEQILEFRNDRVNKLIRQTVVMVLGTGMLLLAGAVLTRIYVEKRARKHFIQYITGRGFSRMHAGFLVWTCLLSAGVALVVFANPLQRFMSFWLGPITPAVLLSSLALSLLYFLFILGMLSLYQRRVHSRVLTESSN